METHLRILAARFRPSFAKSVSLPERGRGECRVMASPMARLQQKKQAAVTTGSAGSSDIPRATVLRLIPRSPWSAGLDSLHRLREVTSRRLDPSVGESGPHGFAVRAGLARLATPARPSHPVPTFVAIGQTPLHVEAGRADRTICF